MISLSREEAARFLVNYQLRAIDMAGVFTRLGSVQYDPLNPVGRNPDLVFAARVPGYQVDDWQTAVYTDRLAYDGWDKQACLVAISDWPMRAPIRRLFHPWHDRQILDQYPEVVETVFAELDGRGPLSSLEFEDRRRAPIAHSWHGPTVIKRVLRALWVRGELVTHHRESGRHYYDRPERVIPVEHLARAPLEDLDVYYRWIVRRRHRSAGLLRPAASPEIWSVCGDAVTRKRAIAELCEEGVLAPVEVGMPGRLYHMPADVPVDISPPLPRVTFVGPLDSLLWDRKAVKEIFGFDYVWEVYKREPDRRWGYYVLPVLYGDRFIARVDSRLEGKTWKIQRWWWEEGVTPDSDLVAALRDGLLRFTHYLRAEQLVVEPSVDRRTRQFLRLTR